MGDRGLKGVEQQYKELKIKTTFRLYTSTYQAVKAAAQADQARRSRERKSLMKDAEKYAEKFGVDICKDSNDNWTIKCTTDTTGEKQELHVLRKRLPISHGLVALLAKDQVRGFPRLNCWNCWNCCSTDIVTDME